MNASDDALPGARDAFSARRAITEPSMSRDRLMEVPSMNLCVCVGESVIQLEVTLAASGRCWNVWVSRMAGPGAGAGLWHVMPGMRHASKQPHSNSSIPRVRPTILCTAPYTFDCRAHLMPVLPVLASRSEPARSTQCSRAVRSSGPSFP